jgi:hypothetical protein
MTHKRKGAGRPRGTYTSWTPARIAQLWWDADEVIGEDEVPVQEREDGVIEKLVQERERVIRAGKVNVSAVARRVKRKFRDRYLFDTPDMLRRHLSKEFESWRSSEDDVDDFNKRMWKHMLDEE